jgi:hypothetical protein
MVMVASCPLGEEAVMVKAPVPQQMLWPPRLPVKADHPVWELWSEIWPGVTVTVNTYCLWLPLPFVATNEVCCA